MTLPHVLPAIGCNYGKGLLKKKVMLVGESSYGGPQNYPNYKPELECQYLMDDAIGYDDGKGYWNKSKFYTRICRIFGVDPHVYEQRRDFWNSVAFYNYLLGSQPKARAVPSWELWLDSHESFCEALKAASPDVVLGFSKRMWTHVSRNRLKEDGPKISCAAFFQTCLLPSSRGAKGIPAAGLLHPCGRGFVWQRYTEPVRSLLEVA